MQKVLISMVLFVVVFGFVLVGKQLGGCESPAGYCYERITKFRRGV